MIRKLIGKLLGSSKTPTASSTSSHVSKRGGHGRGQAPGAKSDDGPKREAREGGQRRRRRRGGRKGDAPKPGQAAPSAAKPERDNAPSHERRASGNSSRSTGTQDGPGKKRRRSRRGRGRGEGRGRSAPASAELDVRQADDEAPPSEPAIPAAPAEPVEVPAVSEDNEFTGLGLVPAIAAAAEAKGYQIPTPIQSEAIPIVLEGRDVIGSAQTGTGKTAAFCLPILQKLESHGALRCLILEPTRELASQVGDALAAYSKFTHLRSTVIYGGVGYGPQRAAIEAGLDIVVATPGRLLDHLEQRSFSLREVHYLVLDEVDRMLDMGFLPDVKRIIGMCPKERQTLFFSATIPPELEKLTAWCLRDPHTIEIGRRRSAAETVSHAFYPVIESQKFDLLQKLLEDTHYESVLIFCRTKHGADFVANRLERQGHKVAVMHSNRSQSERTEALNGFKSGKYEVMVATDVAARGLDIQGISHVINFDTPQHAEDYVHRIGRTGRAHNEGDAFTLLTEEESKYAHAIERFIGQKVERKKVDGFSYQYSAVFESQEGDAANVFRSRLFRGAKKKR